MQSQSYKDYLKIHTPKLITKLQIQTAIEHTIYFKK